MLAQAHTCTHTHTHTHTHIINLSLFQSNCLAIHHLVTVAGLNDNNNNHDPCRTTRCHSLCSPLARCSDLTKQPYTLRLSAATCHVACTGRHALISRRSGTGRRVQLGVATLGWLIVTSLSSCLPRRSLPGLTEPDGRAGDGFGFFFFFLKT